MSHPRDDIKAKLKQRHFIELSVAWSTWKCNRPRPPQHPTASPNPTITASSASPLAEHTQKKGEKNKKNLNCEAKKENNSCNGVEATHVCELKDEVLILQRPTEQPAYVRNTKKNAFTNCPEK